MKSKVLNVHCCLALAWCLSLPLLASAAATGKIEPGPVESWGESTQVVQAGRFFIAGQPDSEALERAKSAGASIVIDLRADSEFDWDEGAAAESLGLEYYRVPVNGAADQLAPEPLIQISEIVQANPDARIFVHCSSGTRASAWFAVYLADYLGMGVDEAIAVANETGLKSKSMEDKVRTFLER